MNEISLNLNERTGSIPFFSTAEHLLYCYYCEYPVERNTRKDLLCDVYSLIDDIFEVFNSKYDDEDKILIANAVYSLKGSTASVLKLASALNREDNIIEGLSYEYILRNNNIVKYNNDSDIGGIQILDTDPMILNYPTIFKGIKDPSCVSFFIGDTVKSNFSYIETASADTGSNRTVLTEKPSWVTSTPVDTYYLSGESVYDVFNDDGSTSSIREVYFYENPLDGSGCIIKYCTEKSSSVYSDTDITIDSAFVYCSEESNSCTTSYPDGSKVIQNSKVYYNKIGDKIGSYKVIHEIHSITPTGTMTSSCYSESYTIKDYNTVTYQNVPYEEFMDCWINAKNLSISRNYKKSCYTGDTSCSKDDEIVENFCVFENGTYVIDSYVNSYSCLLACGVTTTYYSHDCSFLGESNEYIIESCSHINCYQYKINSNEDRVKLLVGGEYFKIDAGPGTDNCGEHLCFSDEGAFNLNLWNKDVFSYDTSFENNDIYVSIKPDLLDSNGSIKSSFLTKFREGYASDPYKDVVSGDFNICVIEENNQLTFHVNGTCSTIRTGKNNTSSNTLVDEIVGYEYSIDARKVILELNQISVTNKTRFDILFESIIQDLLFVTVPTVSQNIEGGYHPDNKYIDIVINGIKYNLGLNYNISNAHTSRIISNSIPTSYFVGGDLLWNLNS